MPGSTGKGRGFGGRGELFYFGKILAKNLAKNLGKVGGKCSIEIKGFFKEWNMTIIKKMENKKIETEVVQNVCI